MGNTNTDENTVTITISEYRKLMEESVEFKAENALLRIMVETLIERNGQLKKESRKNGNMEDDGK